MSNIEEQGLNSMALKVYEAVPLGEAWTRSQIHGELRRQGRNVDVPTVEACLHALRGHKLIREPKGGHYMRVPVKAEKPSAKDSTEYFRRTDHMGAPAAQPKKPENDTVLEDMAQLASDLREHAKAGEALAQRLDDLALKVNAAMADIEKVKQLKGLLQGL